MRIDRYLVTNGYFESRNQALEAIKSGKVTIGLRPVKPSHKVTIADCIQISDEKFYVSRAALKLKGYLANNPLDITGRKALDIGSSTGGFTEVLLEYGASSVDCVDVGSNQLHQSLRDNPKIRVYEQTDIRHFQSADRYELIVSDVSFISLLHILPHIERLASKHCDIILLFKPQFEVGKDAKRDKKGVVTDEIAINTAIERFEQAADELGWKLHNKVKSTISGKEGNLETVYRFMRVS
jgi:23S rRNA (cytidine1920-2'-O)/16S rRNA (cytidine1409-2'-O)-methyltransferase